MKTSTSKPRGPVVLIIDDDEVGRLLIKENLPHGSDVLELSSPIGATRTALDADVDVIVLDLEMPNLRGDALTKLFRANARLRHVGVILVSGCAPHALAELAPRCGADRWLAKNQLRSELSEAVIRVSRLARARQRPGADGEASGSSLSAESGTRSLSSDG